jgi:AcrR family transcriptional regulator
MMREADDDGTPRRARLPAAERRETILRAAATVFAESGYRAAKVSDVAARVGVSEPVIFQNFGSKAALFTAVVGRAPPRPGTPLMSWPRDPGRRPGCSPTCWPGRRPGSRDTPCRPRARGQAAAARLAPRGWKPSESPS